VIEEGTAIAQYATRESGQRARLALQEVGGYAGMQFIHSGQSLGCSQPHPQALENGLVPAVLQA
jgi:hypothetical protein